MGVQARRRVINVLGDESIKTILGEVNSNRTRYRLNREVIDHLEHLVNLGYLERLQSPPYKKKKLPDVFICHSSNNKSFARRVATDIEGKGYSVWFDEFEMLPGDSLYEKIQAAIKKSAWFLIILSPDSVESKWCKRELHNAMEEEFERNRVYVVPVLYKPCDIPGFLKEKVYIDCQGRRYRKGLDRLLERLSMEKSLVTERAMIEFFRGHR